MFKLNDEVLVNTHINEVFRIIGVNPAVPGYLPTVYDLVSLSLPPYYISATEEVLTPYPVGDILQPYTPNTTQIHNHTWKRYTGLKEQFEYCETCDEKRK